MLNKHPLLMNKLAESKKFRNSFGSSVFIRFYSGVLGSENHVLFTAYSPSNNDRVAESNYESIKAHLISEGHADNLIEEYINGNGGSYWLIVRIDPDNDLLMLELEDILYALEQYPIYSEDHFSQMESDRTYAAIIDEIDTLRYCKGNARYPKRNNTVYNKLNFDRIEQGLGEIDYAELENQIRALGYLHA